MGFWAIVASIALAQGQADEPARPRVVVLTDISSLTAGQAEPDDGQSLIRLMLYTNELDIEGLIATSNMQHGLRTRSDLIRQVVDAYDHDHAQLVRHDGRFPPADRLRGAIRSGQPKAGPRVPVVECVGAGRDTEGSNAIIAVVDRPDPRPVWVIIWGGSTDLAQALWKVRSTRSESELQHFVNRLRVHAIGDQDTTGPWIREQFPNLWMITQRRAYRGMYRGGDTRLVGPEWVEQHIKKHGALGRLYPNYQGGDIWSGRLGAVRGIKEGDTPSFLALIPNGLLGVEAPELGSWGGRFSGKGALRTDLADLDLVEPTDPDPRMSSVHRWRSEFQADFQARLTWCDTAPEESNHPPTVRLAGPLRRTVAPGTEIRLDARASSDPDRRPLRFHWSVDHPDQPQAPDVTLEAADTPEPRIRVGPTREARRLSILLRVTDQGTPPLTRYGRLLLDVVPN
ncbi:MAG: DUF1593 domain-containing protein [Isosphaeraceae bacterium]